MKPKPSVSRRAPARRWAHSNSYGNWKRRTGRRLEVFARGRPKGKSSGPEDEAAQECLFAGHEE